MLLWAATSRRSRAPSRVRLLLITQQLPFGVPDLEAVSVDYVVIWTQGFGSFDRRFERFKNLHGMAAVSRDVKRSVYAMILSGISEKFA
jgi:hypothetical protein